MPRKDSKESRIPVVVILGPTASGKSDLAVELALKLDRRAEIISADSRQIYTGLDIGTGKITKREMKHIPHHLLDVADPKIPANSPRSYSVEKWKNSAEKIIEEIHARGNIPIVCGGTGFYITALIDGIVFPDVPPNKKLRKELATLETTELFATLTKLDPRRAKNMNKIGGDANNRPRIIRAIEIATELGSVPPITRKVTKYEPIFIGIAIEPDELAKRIERRLDKRFKNGMIDEVKKLLAKPPRGLGLTYKRLNELGLEYRFIGQFLHDNPRPAQQKKAFPELREKLALAIRHYAKRQMTWFKRDSRITWY